jgi:hypothetical protein
MSLIPEKEADYVPVNFQVDRFGNWETAASLELQTGAPGEGRDQVAFLS